MNDQILAPLKRKLDDLTLRGEVDVEIQRNVLKEELQYYVLDFIYHHPQYGNWIVYGGSALRICHGLDRMSVDLDFEIKEECTDSFLNGLKSAIGEYFRETYSIGNDFLTIKITRGRGILLRFVIGDALGIGHPSKQIHVKIDLNRFTAPKTVTERIPVIHGQLAFVITTYNMSALMASKIAAIFLRGKRGIGEETYEEKGRDIYDLLWYMGQKATPDLDYLKAKGVDMSDLRKLFDRLTIRMNKVSDANLRQDLLPLFTERIFIENWLKQWRENYFRLVESYEIHTVTTLSEIIVRRDIRTDTFFFTFMYDTEEGTRVWIDYALSDYWVRFREGDLPASIPVEDSLITLISSDTKERINSKLGQYVTLFYRKTQHYLRKTNQVILGDNIETKTIRMTADKLNQKEQIVLNKSALLSCELEDLLK